MSELVWFENPTWERHVLATGISQMVNCVVVEGGKEIVLASGFPPRARQQGHRFVLRPEGDVRRPWTPPRSTPAPPPTACVWRTSTDGAPVVVNAPLTGADASRPITRLPRAGLLPPGEWKRARSATPTKASRTVCSYRLGWRRPGRDSDRSFTGIHLFHLEKERPVDGARSLAAGDPAPWPKSGIERTCCGQPWRGKRFLAAIEPWHGNRFPSTACWKQVGRQVIEDKISDGHRLLTAI